MVSRQCQLWRHGLGGQQFLDLPARNTLNSSMHLNTYYLSAATPKRLKVVWAHEMGHSLGLGHVPELKRVMYSSASSAFNAGVEALTSDEVSGINSLY